VRSALLSVKGVTRAQVRLEEHEAIVTYDPAQAKIDDMIKAVAEAEGPGDGRGQYKATVKKK
jgi:copper chaperone CopZ